MNNIEYFIKKKAHLNYCKAIVSNISYFVVKSELYSKGKPSEETLKIVSDLFKRMLFFSSSMPTINEENEIGKKIEKLSGYKQDDENPAGVPVEIEGLNIITAKKRHPKNKEIDKLIQEEFKRLSEVEIEVDDQDTLSTKLMWDALVCWNKDSVIEKNGSDFYIRNSWNSYIDKYIVTIQQDLNTGRCSYYISNNDESADAKIGLYLNTQKACTAYTLEAEEKAMACLKSKITPEQYLKYVMSGTFVEKSKKSGLNYLFRRLRPTIVYRELKNEDTGELEFKFIIALCAHAQGYYGGTWAGTLVPTDDVISHLLMMRSNEHMFWKKSTHHQRSPQADF